jgi:hypothetical protein
MLSSRLLCGAAVLLVSAATAGSASAKEQFTSFDPQGSVYTFAAGINASGSVAGYYQDSEGMTHGFLRASDGKITSFDGKGSTLTEATGINDKGEIAGWYRDESGTFFSFVRGIDGTMTKFNPTKGNEPGMVGLNEKGKVAGWYITGDQEAGFVGAPDGKIKQLTVGGMAINTRGAVTGVDGSEGFVRSASGKMVSFEGPNDPDTTIPTSINDSGAVAGYSQTVCGIGYGFERDSKGDVSLVGPGDSYYSYVMGMNDKGALTGYYYYSGYEGFVRDRAGAYTSFEVPGATDGTYPQAINTKGEVTGGYRDGSDVLHGFVGTP